MKIPPPSTVFIPRLTTHSRERARQRLSWNEATLHRMAEKALCFGITHHETKGRLRKYLDQLWSNHHKANNTRVYGHTVYLFTDNSLLTIWPLPNEYKPLADVLHYKLRINPGKRQKTGT